MAGWRSRTWLKEVGWKQKLIAKQRLGNVRSFVPRAAPIRSSSLAYRVRAEVFYWLTKIIVLLYIGAERTVRADRERQHVAFKQNIGIC